MHTQRQRLRIACEPCRTRKRKCDGSRPCNVCVGYGYDCSYRSKPRSRHPQRNTRQTQAVDTQETSNQQQQPLSRQPCTRLLGQHQRQCQRQSQEDQSPGEQSQERQGHDQDDQEQQRRGQQEEPQHKEPQGPSGYLRSAESNSGAAFARLLTMTLESSDRNVSPMQMLAWNLFLGERQKATPIHEESLTAILTEPKMQQLAMIYFEKVHPCYGFIDKDILQQTIWNTWINQRPSNVQDAVLCGVAALACLFSGTQDVAVELSLVALAKRRLDPSIADPPSLYSATAWLLRTVYLRITAKPEEAWLASCNTLHIMDAAKLTTNVSPGSAFSLPQDSRDPHLPKMALLGVAQHLNTWMSYDLGRNRVVLSNIDDVRIPAQPGVYTAELLDLLPYSQDLDPANRLSEGSLVAALRKVLGRVHTQPPSVLAQCNLMLCIHRRLYASKSEIPGDLMEKILELIHASIQAVHASITTGLPWHHVANIPFQAVCTLLVMDTLQSFAILGDCLDCVVAVHEAYQTTATREAATAARTLIQLHRRRREADMRRHSEMLDLYPSAAFLSQESHGDVLNGDTLQDLWWFNEFVAHSDLIL
ncbi:hypothetical protein BU24DRAFT_453337 [Aaosphaeria arxii CBS 175.79]|uniref:Zn(2)-C6 fungal-type domain-containing protein n=1 Tax=Aaosphaeria arxii CBS 175.79 TaxID=1450172 RepID=A0A6A5XIJ7_9PLEO|nr:uncharacterized protein BU24DRAFT_453337 [Aaosphaeria arxii CBS 175.79]KAF2013078.1 hypothetical protein BU24DRAFT_453337 [Aaosphaeria arxii CBS 175.79]